MQLKLLACDVLTREICHCVARCPHTISLAFTPKGEHNVPEQLRARLQRQIDAVGEEDYQYDAILMGYGLCGNGILGLESRDLPVVIPRAHDCTTLFLGSKAAFQEHFGANPSQTWASVGYVERGGGTLAEDMTREAFGLNNQTRDELVALYGEENAGYMAEMLKIEHGSNELFFLDVPETRMPNLVERIQREANDNGLGLRTIPGSTRLIDKLIAGDWNDDEFLTLPPRHRVHAVYDHHQVIQAVPV